MSGSSITLGDAAATFTMLEIACQRCERRGRLRIDRLIERFGADRGLPELADLLRGDCPKAEAVAVGERCSLFYPQLLRLWEHTGKSLDEL
jgi:hypothetical protein